MNRGHCGLGVNSSTGKAPTIMLNRARGEASKMVRALATQRFAREGSVEEGARRPASAATPPLRKGQKMASDMLLSTFGALAVAQLAISPVSRSTPAVLSPDLTSHDFSTSRGDFKQQPLKEEQQQSMAGLAVTTDRDLDRIKRAALYPAWNSKSNPLAMTATPGSRPPEFAVSRSRMTLAERCNNR